MRINLNGRWQFKNLKDKEFFSADIPSCNFIDLHKNNLIKDPFYGTNEKDLDWVANQDWEYERLFDVSDELLSQDKIFLVCEQLDTICDVFINDNLIYKANNCHIKHEINIKGNLIKGSNKIRVVFYSPVKYVEEIAKENDVPVNMNGQNGIVYIRKPQSHFGWDWGPILTPSGISGNIYIQTFSKGRIKDFYIEQFHQNDKVLLEFKGEIENFSEKDFDYEIIILTPQKKEVLLKGSSKGKIEQSFFIENPELWWTYELSKSTSQPLYDITLTIKSEEVACDCVSKKIGLRTIVLNRSEDEFGCNFQFVLNGIPIFVKGANWIPADSFINNFSNNKLNYLIDSCLFSNFNMIRVWGGGYYESDEFYEQCDEKGILVWQDFAFACQPYPFFNEDFLKNVEKEIEYNVKRLKNHASLALWCGNNEIEAMSINWIFKKNYIEWTEKFFYNILPSLVENLDTQTPFIEGTPCGISHKNGFDKDNVGDTHLWAVWHGLQPMNYYRKRMTRFCSEFGFESLPSLKTIQTFATTSDYDLNSEVFLSHQKCNSGNNKMVFYIASRFRLPKKFEDYIYLSQICQQECIKDATEHWRRNKGRCNGAMYWQLNDCWPVCSWSSIDYYGNYKALQYTSRHFNAPVCVSINDSNKNVEVVASNDLLDDFNGEVTIQILTFEGQEVYSEKSEVFIKSNTYATVYSNSLKNIKALQTNIKSCVFVATIKENGVIINRKTLLFDVEKNLSLPKPTIEKSVVFEKELAKITLKSDKFVRLLRLENESSAPFSDNYFDLLPNESVEIYQKLDREFANEGEYLAKLNLFNVSNVVPKSNRLKDFITKTKIFFIPINFLSWIYNYKIPKDVKKDILKQK